MPTYQYRCQDCDGLHEVFQSFSDDALTVCPSCNGSLRKLYNSVGVVFKGTGFYRTCTVTDSSGSSRQHTATGGAADPLGCDAVRSAPPLPPAKTCG
mgnify:CR=1 FL=1